MTTLNLQWVTVTSAGLTTATTAYVAGDGIGSQNTLTIPNSKSDAFIVGLVITDKSDILVSVTVFPHISTVTFATDNAAPSISDTDNLTALPYLEVSAFRDLGGCHRGSVDSISVPIHASASSQVFFSALTETAHTFFGAATDIQYNFLLAVDT